MMPGSGFEAGGWHGAARLRTGGAFTYCVIRRAYPNGIELSLARSPEGLFFLGLKNPVWRLSKGSEARARIGVDAPAGDSQSAQVVSTDTVLFTFWPRDGAVYAALLSSGTRLTVADLSVSPEMPVWEFDLAGTRDGLEALERCVADHGRTSAASAPE